MSDTNRVALRIVKESVFGTTPATPAFKELRSTGQPNLAFAPSTVVSNEIRADRQISDLILVGAEAGGDSGHELSFRALQDLIEGAMYSTYQERANRFNEGGAAQITSITTGANDDVNVTDEAVDFVAGDLVFFQGFNDANDGFIGAAVAGTTATIVRFPTATLTANASPPATARIHAVGVEGGTADIVAAITPNRLTSTVLDFTTLDLSPGDWIKIGGSAAANQFATTANNDWCRVSSISANSLEFDIVPSGFAADVGTGKDIWLFFGERIRNGVVDQSYTLEQEFSDHSPVDYQYFRGMRVGVFNMQMAAQAIVTITASYQGKDAVTQTSRFAGASTIPAPENSVLNTSSNVGRIARDGVPIAGANFVLEASVEINNNLRRQNAVGQIGSIGIGAGEAGITGTLNTYFDNLDLLDDVITNAETSLDFRVVDVNNDNKTMVIDLPRVKYSAGAPAVPGKNQDVTINLEYQAIRHPTLGYTTQFQRHWAVQ